MRVAQFIDTASEGGAETIVLDLCRQLRERGIEPVLLHFGSEYLQGHAKQLGIEQHVAPGWTQYKSFKTLPLFALQFRRFLRQLNIDALHSHLFGPITAAAPACALAGVRHVGTLHDVYVVAERPIRIRLLQMAALMGTRLVSVSADMERFYRQRAYFGRQALRTIYNGTRHAAAAPREDLREALGLSADDTVIICVGRLVELKNHRLLIRAFAALDAAQPTKLLLVGDGPLRNHLEQAARECGVAARVQFLGRRDDVADLLAISDIFALASNTEGLSCSVLEAMAGGLPAAVTRVGGNPELVEDGISGYLIEPGDTDQMRDRLRTLVLDAALRRRLGQAARQRAMTLFSFDRMIDGYIHLYSVAPGATAEAAGHD